MKTIYNQIKDRVTEKIPEIAHTKKIAVSIITNIAMNELDFIDEIYYNKYHVNLKTMHSETVLRNWTGQDIENIVDEIVNLIEFTLCHTDIYANVEIKTCPRVLDPSYDGKKRTIIAKSIINNMPVDIAIMGVSSFHAMAGLQYIYCIGYNVKLKYDNKKYIYDGIEYPCYSVCDESVFERLD